MPAYNPFRCSYSTMVQRGSSEIALLDTGSYPGFAKIQNATFTFTQADGYWLQKSPATSPTPNRTDYAMAYDGYNVVMFGGREQTNGPCQDTWSWNGTTWTKLAPATVPFARFQSEMALISGTLRTVMFGGASMLDLTNETWVWNGNLLTWTLANSTSNPSVRTDFGLAGGVTKAVLFGGKNQADLLGDTWTFDGTQWTQATPTTPPPPREGMSLVYDATNDLYVMFGGSNGYDVNNETWTLNTGATAWTQRAPATPPPARRGGQMCYDSVSGKVLLTGGSDSLNNALNDTWSFNGATFAWTQL